MTTISKQKEVKGDNALMRGSEHRDRTRAPQPKHYANLTQIFQFSLKSTVMRIICQSLRQCQFRHVPPSSYFIPISV